jgi:hypothetical protein
LERKKVKTPTGYGSIAASFPQVVPAEHIGNLNLSGAITSVRVLFSGSYGFAMPSVLIAVVRRPGRHCLLEDDA